MSDPAFHKILCGQCAGKIEFPADYAGQTIPCPHCQTLVVLRIPPAAPGPENYEYPDPASLTPEDVAKGHKAKWSIIYAVAVLVGINLILGIVFLLRSKSPAGPVAGLEVTSWKLEPGEYRTFFVTGVVSNTTARSIPKARVEFETLDNLGTASGKVSTTILNLEPNAAVPFSMQTSATQTVWDARLVGVYLEKE